MTNSQRVVFEKSFCPYCFRPVMKMAKPHCMLRCGAKHNHRSSITLTPSIIKVMDKYNQQREL